MKNSKFFLSTLVAAAMMSTSAYANNYANQTITADTTATYTNNSYPGNLVTGTTSIAAGATWTWGNPNGSGHGMITQTGTLSGAGTWLFTRTQTSNANFGRFLNLGGDNSAFTGTFKIRSSDGDNTTGPNVAILLGNADAATNAVIDLGQCTGVAFAGGTTSANVGGINGTSAKSWITSKSSTPTAGVYSTNTGGGTWWYNDSTVCTLNLTGSGTYSFAGIVGDATHYQTSLLLNKSGTGSQTFSGTVTTGAVTVSAGTLAFSGTANIGGAVTVSGGTLDFTGSTATFSGTTTADKTISLSGAGSLKGLSLSSGGIISVASGSTATISTLVVAGGLVDASAESITTSGGTTLTSGTLKLNATAGSETQLNVSDTGVGIGSGFVFDLVGATASTEYTILNTATTVVGWDALTKSNFTVDGSALGGRATVTLSHVGDDYKVSFAGAVDPLVWVTGAHNWDTTATDAWTLSGVADVFIANDDVKFESGDNTATLGENIAASKMVVAAGTTSLVMGTYTLTVATTLDIASGAKLSLDVDALTATGGIKGAGTLSFDVGAGEINATANNVGAQLTGFTGTLEIASGRYKATNALPGVSVVVKDGGQFFTTMAWSTAVTIAGTGWNASSDSAKAGALRLSGGTTFSGALTLAADASMNVSSSETATFSGSIAGEGFTLSKVGDGLLLITGNQLASGFGKFSVDAGIVQLNHDSTARTIAVDLNIASGATFTDRVNYKYAVTVSGELSGAGTFLTSVPTTAGQTDGAKAYTFTGNAEHFTGDLAVVASNGTTGAYRTNVTLNPADGIFGGTVKFQGVNNNDNVYSATAVPSMATVSISKDMSVGAIAGVGGTFSIGAHNLTLLNDSTFAGVLAGTGDVTISSDKKLTYTGNTTGNFTGAFVLEGGATLSGTTLTSGSISFSGTGTKTLENFTLNGGIIQMVSGGVLTSYALAGTTVLTSGTIDVSGYISSMELGTEYVLFTNAGALGADPIGAIDAVLDSTTKSSVTITNDSGTIKISLSVTEIIWQDPASAPGTWTATNFGGYGTYASNSFVKFDSTTAGTDAAPNQVILSGDITVPLATIDAGAGGAFEFAGDGKLTGGTSVTVKSGTLILTAASDYSGTTKIKSGATLKMNQEANSTLAGDAVIDGTMEHTGAGTLRLEGVISGAGTISQNSSGTLIFAANNTFSGTFNIDEGTIQVGRTGDVIGDGAYTGKTFTGVAGTTLSLYLTGNVSDDGASDSTSSRVEGMGAYAGAIKINSGLLSLEDAGNLDTTLFNSAEKFILNGGGLLFKNIVSTGVPANVFSKDIEVTANSVIRIYGSGDVEISGNVTGTKTLKHTDGGILTFTGNVDLGGFTNARGTTIFTQRAKLGIFASGDVPLNYGTVTLRNGADVTSTSISLRGGNLDIGGDFTRVDGSGNAVTSGFGTIELRNGTTVNQTAGTVTAEQVALHNMNDSTTETYNLSGGVLNATRGSGSIQTNSALLLGHWGNGTGIMNVSGTGVVNVLSGHVQLGWDSGARLNISGGEVNAYSLTKRDRTVASQINLTGGRLNVGAGGITPNGTALTVTLDGGTLGAFESWSTSQAMTVGATGVTIDTQTRITSATGASTQGTTGSNITLSGAISGTGPITKEGLGTLTLSAANTFTGMTTVNAGSLAVGNATALGTGGVTLNGTSKLILNSRINLGAGAMVTSAGSAIEFAPTVLSATDALITSAATVNPTNLVFQSSGAVAAGKYKLFDTGNIAYYTADKLGTEIVFKGIIGGRGSPVTYSVEGQAVFATVGAAEAARTLIWDSSVGTGVWDAGVAANTVWHQNGSATLEAFYNLDTAIFQTSANVTQQSNIISPSLRISNAGTNVVISAGTYSFSASTLILEAGTSLKSDASVFESSLINISAGSELQLSAVPTTSSSTRSITLGGVLQFNNLQGAATLQHDVAGAGSLILNGGTLVIAANKTYTGGTTVNAGTLRLGVGGSVGPIRGTLTVNTGGTVEFAAGDATGYSATAAEVVSVINAIGGTINITTTSNQTLSNVALTLAGGTITGISGSKFDLYRGGSSITTTAGSGQSVISTGVGLRQDNSNFTINEGSSLLVSGVMQVGNTSQGNHILIKNGTGSLILTAANTYTGVTTINAGTVQVGNGGTSGTLGTGAVSVASGASLIFNRSNSYSVANGITGAGTIYQRGLGIGSLNGTVNVGAIDISAGGISSAGSLTAGTVMLSAGALSTTGAFSAGTVTLNGGVSSITGNSTIGTLSIGAGAALNLGGTVTLSRAIEAEGNVVINSATNFVLSNLDLQTSGASSFYEIVSISGAGTAPGWTSLTNANFSGLGGRDTITSIGSGTDTGKVFVNVISLSWIGGDGTWSTGVGGWEDTTPAPTNFQASDHVIFNTGTTNTITLGGNVAPSTVTVSGAGTDVTISAPSGSTNKITGAAGIKVENDAKLTLATVNDYTGATIVRTGGTLTTAVAGALGSGIISGDGTIISQGAIITNHNGLGDSTWTGRLEISDVSSATDMDLTVLGNADSTIALKNITGHLANGTKTIAADIELLDNGLTINNGYSSASSTFAGDIFGDGDFTVNTATVRHTLAFTGDMANYSGDMNITAAAAGTTLTFGAGSNYTGTGSVSGTGAIAWGNATGAGTITYNYANDILAANGITGNVALVKQGAGTLSLTGDSNFSQGTTVSEGSLQLGNGGTTGTLSGDVSVASGATFGVNRSDEYTFAGIISGAGGFTQAGSGTTILSGANTYTGKTLASAGTLQIDGTLAAASTVEAASGAKVVFNRGDSNYDLSGRITGAGTLVKQGTGRLTLSGSDISIANIDLTAGTLSNARLNRATAQTIKTAAGTTLHNVTLNSTTAAIDASAVTTGQISLAGTNAWSYGTVKVDNLGSRISEGRFSLSSGASLAIGTNVKLNLGSVEVGKNYQILTGDTSSVSGWNTLTAANFELTGLTLGARTAITISSTIIGQVSFQTRACDLVWNGGATGTWDTETANTVWQTGTGASLETGLYFIGRISDTSYDTVTFESSASVDVATDVTTGSLTIKGSGTNVTLSTTSDKKISIADSGKLTVDAGAQLSLGVQSEFSGGTDVAGTLVITSGGTLGTGAVDVASTGALTVASGATWNQVNAVTNAGAMTVAGTLVAGANLANSGTLDLTAGTVEISIANPTYINNTGTVNVATGAGGTVFNLVGAQIGQNYSLISSTGAPIAGWASLTNDNFQIDGVTVGGRKYVEFNGTDGTVKISGTQATLVWEGDASGAGTWNTQPTNEAWNNPGLSAADSFLQSDKVEFRKDADIIVSGNVNPQTMLVDGAVAVSISGTGKISECSGLTIQNGATLSLDSAHSFLGATTVDASSSLVLSIGANSEMLKSAISGNGRLELDVGTGTVANIDTVLTGRISGGLSLEKSGAGTLSIATAQNYTGGTTIKSGTVAVSHFDALGTGDVSIDSGASLNMGFGSTGVWTRQISGDGTLVKSGIGVLELSGVISVENLAVRGGTLKLTNNAGTNSIGAISVDSGKTLYVNNVAALSGAGAISGNGIFQFDLASAQTFDRALSGTLKKTGAGTLTLSATSSTLKTINLEEGQLTLSAANNGLTQVGVASGTTLLVTKASALAASTVTNAGTLTFNSAAGESERFAGRISGAGAVNKTGSGTVRFAGSNDYSGETTVSGGKLIAATKTSLGTGHFTVINGATVEAEKGITGGLFTVSGSTFKAGEMTVSGTFGHVSTNRPISVDVSSAGTTFAFNIVDQAMADQALFVGTGSVSDMKLKLDTTTLAISLEQSFVGGDAHIKLIEGTVAVDNDRLGSVLVNGHRVDYQYDPITGMIILDESALSAGLHLAISSMFTMPVTAFNTDVQTLRTRMEQRRYDIGYDGEWSFFAQVQTNIARAGSGDNSLSFDYNTYGGIAGADLRVSSQTLVGVALAYDTGKATITDNQGEISMDDTRATIYCSSTFADRFFADYGVQAGYSEFDVDRSGYAGNGSGNTSALSAGAYVNAGTLLVLSAENALYLSPYVGMSYMHNRVDNYSESGTESTAMDISAFNADSLRGRVGASFSWCFNLGEILSRFSFDLAYAHEFLDDEVDVSVRNSGSGSTRVIKERALAQDVISVGPAIDFSFDEHAAVFVGYSAEISFESDVTHHVNAGFRYTF